MKRLIRSIPLILLLSSMAGCGLIYKQNVQQGNALEDEDLDQLYLGMNKRQVLFVLGSPSIHDPFQPQRWDYVQTYSRRGGEPTQRTITLRFENDELTEIIGYEPAGADDPDSAVAASGAAAQPDPHKESVEDASAEALEPEIRGLGERTADERELEAGRDVINQRPADDLTSPDIDG
ncbi:outer membrane protein assembly factor BamE [Elongatibacter sediminis]|uniref:Outer membrane protein assembly factor BamE n=1 Tax=Elongatibacter sediminis TaxID=3119006 RepID=A0AAW9RAP7_9GAMM